MTQENQTKKFFIYARKSTDSEDRQVRSIGDQLAELRELAKKENIDVIDTLVEKQTAKKPKIGTATILLNVKGDGSIYFFATQFAFFSTLSSPEFSEAKASHYETM